MPNDTNNTGASSLLNTITRLLDTSINAGVGLDNIITVLSLLCLFSIMSRNHAAKEAAQVQTAASTNPLHKLLGDLVKGNDGGGGFSPETLTALLPLLNNPQLKSKLNPSTIGTVMGLINNLGGGSSPSEKSKAETKAEHSATENAKHPKESPPVPQEAASVQQNQTGASTLTQPNEEMEDLENKNYGRYLNWKNNF